MAQTYQVGDTQYQFPDNYTDDQVTGILSKQGIIGVPAVAAQTPPDASAEGAQAPAPADQGLYVNPNTPKPRGMVQQGNIDLRKLPVIDNGDGSYSTVYSTSFTDEKPDSPTFGKDVLVRGILNGKRVDDLESEDKAKRAAANDAVRREYYKTGKHLGVFRPGTDEEYRSQQDPATLYGGALHNDFAAGKIPGFPVTPQKPAQAPPQKPSDTLPDPAAAVQIATALGRHIAEIATRPPTPPRAPTPPRVEAGMPAKSPYDLLPDAGTPTAQSRWTRTPIAYGQTRDVPEPDQGYTDYEANKGKGLISINPGGGELASPATQSTTRHESVHMMLHQAFDEKPGMDFGKVLGDPAVKLYGGRIAKAMRDYGYRGESETEIPAYMAVFSNVPEEWTKNVPLDLRNKYIAAFSKAVAKQDPKAAAKYLRMSAGPRTGEGPSLTPEPARSTATIGALPPPTLAERLKGVVLGDVRVGDTALGRALGLGTETPSSPTYNEAPFYRAEAARPEKGIGRGVAETLTSLGTPGNLELIAGTGGLGEAAPVLTRMLSAGFSVLMLHNAWQESPAFRDAVKRKDYALARQIATKMVLEAALAALALKHAGTKSKPAPEKVVKRAEGIKHEGESPYYFGKPELNPDTFMRQQKAAGGEETHANRKKPAEGKPPGKRESGEPARAEPAVGARGGGEHERSTSVEPRAEHHAEAKEVTAGGPDIKLNEFHANRGGFASAARLVLTSPKKLTSEDIENNFFKGHDISVTKVRPSIFTSQGHPDTQLFDVQFHAPDGAAISAPEGIEESLGLKPGERYVDRPVTGIPKAKPTAAPAQQPLPAIEFGGNEVEPGKVEQFIHNASTPDLLKMRDQATDTYNTALGHTVDDEIQRRAGDINPRRVAFVGDGWIVRGSEELGKYPTQGAALQALIDEHGGVKTVTAAAEPAAGEAGGKIGELPPKPSEFASMRDAEEQRVRETVLAKLAADPETYLKAYRDRFGNVLNADDAATLFEDYNQDRAKYRAAVHPAAAWIRDELLRRSLAEQTAPERSQIFFTAGGNAAGKTSAMEVGPVRDEAHAVFDSTLSDSTRAHKLVNEALAAGKPATIVYVRRPLEDAFRAMLDRAGTEGRVVTIDQMIRSDRGAAETVRRLADEFREDPRVAIRFVDNSSAGTREGSIDLAAPRDYTEISQRLHEILDSEYEAGRISESVYRRVGGKGQPGEPPTGGSRDEGGGGGPQSPVAGESPQSPAAGSVGDTPLDQTNTDAPLEPEERERDTGPTYMGSGFGALEPLFREAKEEGDRLRNARNEALAAAKAAEAKPEEMKAGEKIREYFTAERDLWAARTNQIMDRITRIVLPKIQDREAVGIAREFRHKPQELQEFIDGTHPFLEEVDGGPKVWEKNLKRLMPVLRQAQRILAKPTARERAADAAFTMIAERDLKEGRAGGWLESRWLSDEYVPHALNPKGEGAVAKLAEGQFRPTGKIGKYFGFGETRSERYPTMVHAVADGIIPKTLDPSALFTIHADQFARARATHMLEAHLADSGLGKWGDRKSAPEGWVQLAAHSDEFKKTFAYAVPGSFDPESRESELKTGTMGLYVQPYIAKALWPITAPDPFGEYPGFAKVRTLQRGLKEAILGMSGFHLLTENFMAAADIGPSGMYRAFREPRESPATLANERDFIASGGTTSIQGTTMGAYRSLRPGTVPTRAEVVRGYIWGSKQALWAADAITRFTFENVQRRYKIWSFALHRDAWMNDNPNATPQQLAEAKKGIASYVNGVYGGLHWENMGWSRAMVEVARLALLAPDWSGSNVALAKYAADAPLSPREIPILGRLAGKRLGGATTKESAQARLSRAFWTKQLTYGLVATQMLSLMLSQKLSHRPMQVYMGPDKDGNEVYQNVFFRGSIGDLTNLGSHVEERVKEAFGRFGAAGVLSGLLTGFGVFVQGKAAPITKFGMHTLTGRDDRGRPITPGGLAGDVLPVPIIAKSFWKQFFGDEADKYLWSERILSMFGPMAQHIGESDSEADERRERRRRAASAQ